jgi:hypothetical protein
MWTPSVWAFLVPALMGGRGLTAARGFNRRQVDWRFGELLLSR